VNRSRELIHNWTILCRRYLPIVSDDARWKLSRAVRPDDPEQGWKLHLSATVLNAGEMLERVAPLLQSVDALFKAPASLEELSRINSGLVYGYEQVGKALTVYPQNDEQAVGLARQLHELTFGMAAPAVPFDRQFRPESCVYYRYGAFKELDIQSADGAIPAIRNPEGNLIPDCRQSWASSLDWLSDPLIAFQEETAKLKQTASDNPLKTTFRVFRALSQRGRGGVYQAIDLGSQHPRLCILKEGRVHGETGLDGIDGAQRILREAQTLSHLQNCGVEVPEVYAVFEVEGHSYLAMEHIPGESLHSLLLRRKQRFPVQQALRYLIQISEIVAQLHAAGWAWRDCKPGNLILTPTGQFRPIDFESACPANQAEPLFWKTSGFTPPKSDASVCGGISDDLYALGACLYLFLTGRIPTTINPVPASVWRRNLPDELLSIISELLASEPHQRPNAADVSERLKRILFTNIDYSAGRIHRRSSE
jgi:hypothetical protein